VRFYLAFMRQAWGLIRFCCPFCGLKGRHLQVLPGILGMSAIGPPGTIAAWMDDRMCGIDEMGMRYEPCWPEAKSRNTPIVLAGTPGRPDVSRAATYHGGRKRWRAQGEERALMQRCRVPIVHRWVATAVYRRVATRFRTCDRPTPSTAFPFSSS